MKVSILERAAIQSLEPALIEACLAKKGWEQAALVEGIGSVWAKRVGDEITELRIPHSREVRDFSLRVSETLHSLASLEMKSELDIYQEILFADYDAVVVRLRRSTGGGDLKISQAVGFVTNASEMMLAAACSAASPRPAFLWRRPRRAKDYVEALRAIQNGLDEPTLFILSPIPRVNRLHRFQTREFEPFSRQVISGLANALTATQSFVRDIVGVDRTVADSLVEHGISSNLYDSIVGMFGDDRESEKLRIEIRYAPVLSADDPAAFEISRGEMQALSSTSAQLRQQAEGSTDEEIAVTGSIVGLRRRTRLSNKSV